MVLLQPPGKPAHAPLAGGGPKSTAPSSATSTESRHRQAEGGGAGQGPPRAGLAAGRAGRLPGRRRWGRRWAEERGPPAECCLGRGLGGGRPSVCAAEAHGPGGGWTAASAPSVMCQNHGGARDRLSAWQGGALGATQHHSIQDHPHQSVGIASPMLRGRRLSPPKRLRLRCRVPALRPTHFKLRSDPLGPGTRANTPGCPRLTRWTRPPGPRLCTQHTGMGGHSAPRSRARRAGGGPAEGGHLGAGRASAGC